MVDEKWILDTISDLNSDLSLSSIHEGLEKLSHHLKLDRCIIRNRVPGTDTFTVISEYCAPGLTPINVLEPNMDSDASFHLVQLLLEHDKVEIPDIFSSDDFTQIEKDKARDWGTRSFLFLPLRYQNAINGMIIGINSWEPREWQEKDHFIIQLIGETALSNWLHYQAQEALTASQQKYQQALAASNDVLWEWDVEANEIQYSAHFYHLLGIEPRDEPMKMEELVSHIHPDDLRLLRDVSAEVQLRNVDTDAREFRVVTNDGDIIWLLSRGKITKKDNTGKPIRAVGTYSDITMFKKTLQRLELSHQNAIQANDAKSEFLARMSHDVRTPLNAITGMLHLLEDDNLSDSQKNKVQIMLDSSQQLLNVINNVLDFSKLETGKVELEKIDFCLDNLIQNVCNMVNAEASSKGIDIFVNIDPDIPQTLTGDPNRLSQVLTNLVANAIKFTDEGHIDINVQCRRINNEDVTLQFEVSDTGIGITEDQINVLFDPYVQAERSITRRYGGTGLGLSICKNFIEIMGGSIYARSVYGEGSHFNFSIIVKSPEPLLKSISEITTQPFTNVALLAKSQRSLDTHKKLLINHASSSCTGFLLSEASDIILESLPEFDTVFIEFDAKLTPRPYLENIIERCQKEQNIFLLHALYTEDIARLCENDNVQFISSPLTTGKLNAALTLPDSRKASTNRVLSPTEVKHLRKLKVLLVEDNQVNELIARGILEKYGIEVFSAEHGQMAVNEVYNQKANFFDAILMDIEMPIMNGYEATRLIKQSEKGRNLPIIAMTANILLKDRQEYFEFGLDDHITKPLDPDGLIHALIAHTAGKKTNKSA